MQLVVPIFGLDVGFSERLFYYFVLDIRLTKYSSRSDSLPVDTEIYGTPFREVRKDTLVGRGIYDQLRSGSKR